jgi:hypothetical protein
MSQKIFEVDISVGVSVVEDENSFDLLLSEADVISLEDIVEVLQLIEGTVVFLQVLRVRYKGLAIL